MSEHMFELIVVLSNLMVAMTAIILAFVTYFAIERDTRKFVLAILTLHVRAARELKRRLS